jgi:dipeptidyl aminopeptidase/acylaminoacyl peptidase
MRKAVSSRWRRAAGRADLLVLAVAAVCGLAGGWMDAPQPSPFMREEVRIPVHEGRYSIAITILRPRGAGPYGAIVLNHGVPATAQARSAESPALLLHAAAAFVQRDYAVFMPLRRGFGATGGEFAEDAGPCSDPDFHRSERAAAADVLAAFEFARKRSYVDGSRMILAGQSAGGVASLYAAAQAPQGLSAVLAFAAGRGADPGEAGVPCAAERLAVVFEEVGRAVRAPVLLIYAENDRSFGPSASRLWFGRLKAGGAPAEFVLQPPFGADGHYLFSDKAGIERWLPQVERFLHRHGVPFERPQQRA